MNLAELLFPNVTKTPDEILCAYPPRGLPEGAVVSRHAPSPTGFVHLGNIVQALISERMAHLSGGVLFLRIEDTDKKREVEGAVSAIVGGLSHYDIQFDEGPIGSGCCDVGAYGPYRQSQRVEIYHVFAKHLVRMGCAYPCFCTEDELSEMREKQERGKENFGYYGKYAVWRDRSVEDVEAALLQGRPWVLRYRAEGGDKITIDDLVKGRLTLPANDIDHVMLKSDGVPTYHFAHAVDDRLMHTTHVVRGDEWLATLPYHVQLFRALGFRVPRYAHIGPLNKMDGASKRKLSKRKDPEFALGYYRGVGYPVQSVREYVMTVLNSNFEDWRRANPDKDLDAFAFSYKKLNPAGALFDLGKLRDVSKDVVSRMTAEAVYDETLEWAREFDKDFAALLAENRDYAVAVLSIGRGGKKPRKDYAVWSEIKEGISFFFEPIFKRQQSLPDGMSRDDYVAVLRAYSTWRIEFYNRQRQQNPQLESEQCELPPDANAWFDELKQIGETLGYCPDTKRYKENPDLWKGSAADVAMALRVAICGRQQTPDLYSVMRIMGMDGFMGRILSAIDYTSKE